VSERPPAAPNPEEPQPLAQIQPQRAVVRLPQRAPVVVYTLIGITVLIFALQLITASGQFGSCPFFNETDLPICYGLKVNELILDGQWWRFVTPMFIHASLLHIGFNLYALYVLGPDLERHFGHVNFLILYLVSGFAGVVLSFLLTAAPSLGASTAIFGLLGAQGIFVYRNQKIFGRRAQMALRNIAQIALINLLIGLSPGIDNWGHVGGLLGGGLFAWFGGPVYAVEGDGVEFHLANRIAPERTWLAAGIVVVIFVALAIVRF
jgi:rhomboid protease GluP